METQSQPLSRDHVINLYALYNGLIRDELNFFLQSFHFYISLLSAILAGTLTGLLSIDIKDMRGLVLLVGPVLIILLSRIGYNNAGAFYRRFTEAWIAKLNLEAMLSLPQESLLEPGIRPPVYKSSQGGFIPQIEWPQLKRIFEDAEKKAWSAEQLTDRLVRVGTTLADAKWTFTLFSIAGMALAVAIVVFFI